MAFVVAAAGVRTENMYGHQSRSEAVGAFGRKLFAPTFLHAVAEEIALATSSGSVPESLVAKMRRLFPCACYMR